MTRATILVLYGAVCFEREHSEKKDGRELTCDRSDLRRDFSNRLQVSTDRWLKSLASTSSLSYTNTTRTLRDHVRSLSVGISWIKI